MRRQEDDRRVEEQRKWERENRERQTTSNNWLHNATQNREEHRNMQFASPSAEPTPPMRRANKAQALARERPAKVKVKARPKPKPASAEPEVIELGDSDDETGAGAGGEDGGEGDGPFINAGAGPLSGAAVEGAIDLEETKPGTSDGGTGLALDTALTLVDWPAGVPRSFQHLGLISSSTPPGVYPGTGHPRAVQFKADDMECLDPGEFLNDTLIDIGALHFQERAREALQRDNLKVHVFGTFFYKKLTAGSQALGPGDGQTTHAERVHQSVKGWTKKVNLFEMDYVFVPIHGSAHWSLAVICHPGNINSVSDDDGSPCTLHFDSLGGGHTTGSVTKKLRAYLNEEYKRKVKDNAITTGICVFGSTTQFNPTSMPGKRMACPQQMNLCDCGLFTLKNMEVLLQHPPKRIEVIPDNGGRHEFHFHGYKDLAYSTDAFHRHDATAFRMELYKLLLTTFMEANGMSADVEEKFRNACDNLDKWAEEVRAQPLEIPKPKRKPKADGDLMMETLGRRRSQRRKGDLAGDGVQVLDSSDKRSQHGIPMPNLDGAPAFVDPGSGGNPPGKFAALPVADAGFGYGIDEDDTSTGEPGTQPDGSDMEWEPPEREKKKKETKKSTAGVDHITVNLE